MAYHNGYGGKLNIEPDFEKAEQWYYKALKLMVMGSLFYLGELHRMLKKQ